MKKIKGKSTTAVVYTDEIEQTAVEQIQLLCDQEFAKDANIRIMPDVHAGAGCTIGTTMKINDKVVPNLVGVDIGCGMEVVELGKVDIDLVKLDRFICKKIPSGFNIRNVNHPLYTPLIEPPLKELKCLTNTDRALKSIGTLGGGNHFIEMNEDDDGNKYVVIHSGSRNLGLQIANHYQDLAFKKLSRDNSAEVIAKLKSEGREAEIQVEIKKLKENKVPKDLSYLEGEDMKDYLHDMRIAQCYAKLNRQAMMWDVINFIEASVLSSFTTIHNYIDLEAMILRKGAVSAKKGEKFIIPINMKDGSLICEGLGNDDWNQSAPHGAGRLMSRSEAFKTFSMEEFKTQMDGIYSTSVCQSTLDESPMAYKSIDNIVNNISPTAKILKKIRPIYNFKASDGGGRRR